MARTTISLPDALVERVDRLRDRINVSKVCALALERECALLEAHFSGEVNLDAMARSPFFADLAPDQLLALVAIGQPRTAQPGDLLMREGASESHMDFLLRGSVEIFQHQGESKQILTVLAAPNPAPFALLGPMGLLGSVVRTASAVALEPCTLLRIEAQDFAALARRDPHLGYVLTHRAASKLLGDFARWVERARTHGESDRDSDAA